MKTDKTHQTNAENRWDMAPTLLAILIGSIRTGDKIRAAQTRRTLRDCGVKVQLARKAVANAQ